MSAAGKKAGFKILSTRSRTAPFVTYFLGAVIPLFALAFFAQGYVFPAISDPVLSYGIVGLVIAIAALSLGSFIALRRSTNRTVADAERDNSQLSSLLKVSKSLAGASHDREVMQIAAECALGLTESRAAYFLAARGNKSSLEVAHSIGEEAIPLYAEHCESLQEMVDLCVEHDRPVHRGRSELAPKDTQANTPLTTATAVPVIGIGGVLGVMLVVDTLPGRVEEVESANSLVTLAGLVSVSLQNADFRDAQRNFFTHVTDILVSALDTHMDHHTGHGLRVAHVSNRIGREMEFDDERLQRLHFAALLHDIGMLKIDPSAAANRRSAQKHTSIGYRMLSRIKVWESLAPLVMHHHEWFDGSGYPEGIAGDEIPLEARIIAVADAFDAMTSAVSYKRAVSTEEAISRLEQCAGTQFDPAVVRVFADLARRGLIETSPAG